MQAPVHDAQPAIVTPDEPWTPEQVQAFQEAWDGLVPDMRLRIGRPLEPVRQMVVVHLWWTEGSIPRQETYGPWAIADDEMTHLAQIRNFLRDWQRVTGGQPNVATMALVMDPAGWMRARETGQHGCGTAAPVGAMLTVVRCPRCQQHDVPVTSGNVTGLSLDDITAEVAAKARQACPDHSGVTVGN
jgi:hypothetical protein